MLNYSTRCQFHNIHIATIPHDTYSNLNFEPSQATPKTSELKMYNGSFSTIMFNIFMSIYMFAFEQTIIMYCKIL